MVTCSSCDRLKRNEHEAIDRTHEEIGNVKQEIIDKGNHFVAHIFPIYDDNKPSSDNNRNYFKKYLNIELTNDVRNIYSCGDFLGADYKVLIAFICDTVTLEKIVRTKGMSISNQNNDEGLVFSEEFPWWDKKIIAKNKPYKIGRKAGYKTDWEYLWYDAQSETAFYEQFSL